MRGGDGVEECDEVDVETDEEFSDDVEEFEGRGFELGVGIEGSYREDQDEVDQLLGKGMPMRVRKQTGDDDRLIDSHDRL